MAKFLPRATTIAEAEAQEFSIPAQFDRQWRQVAGQLDGYAIGEELGINVIEWGMEKITQAMQDGQFGDDVTVLDLRLMLFAVFRTDYMTGYTYHEHDPHADFILQGLSKKMGQPYTPLDSD